MFMINGFVDYEIILEIVRAANREVTLTGMFLSTQLEISYKTLHP